MKLRMYALRPDRETGYVTNISDRLENLQNFVGGYIETVTAFANVVVICNEYGRINGMEKCCNILGHDFYGPVLVCGITTNKHGEQEFDDLHFSAQEIREVLGCK